MALENNTPAESGAVSRRTIIKGAAWAAPVMIAAVAVPAAVASVPTGGSLAPAISNGSHSYTLTLTPTPTTGTIYTLTLSTVNPGQGNGGKFHFGNGVVETSFTYGSGQISISTPNGYSGSLIVSGGDLGSKTITITLR